MAAISKYVVTSTNVRGLFGIFDTYDEAQRRAGEWTEDYGIAFVVEEEFPARVPRAKPPEPWYAHVFRWMLR